MALPANMQTILALSSKYNMCSIHVNLAMQHYCMGAKLLKIKYPSINFSPDMQSMCPIQYLYRWLKPHIEILNIYPAF